MNVLLVFSIIWMVLQIVIIATQAKEIDSGIGVGICLIMNAVTLIGLFSALL